MTKKLLYCSFCGKSQTEVRKLIAGPTFVDTKFSIFICDECVDLCHDIVHEPPTTSLEKFKHFFSPPLTSLQRFNAFHQIERNTDAAQD